MAHFFKRRIRDPLIAVVKQGITPGKLSLALALGFSISISPLIFGFTTLLCAIVAYLLKINQVAIQVGNYIALPIQLILMVPFMTTGEKLFLGTKTDLNTETLRQFMDAGPHAFFVKFGSLFLYGTILWLMVVPILTAILYFILIRPMRKFVKRNETVY